MAETLYRIGDDGIPVPVVSGSPAPATVTQQGLVMLPSANGVAGRFVQHGVPTALTASYGAITAWDACHYNTTAGAIAQPLPTTATLGDRIRLVLDAGSNALSYTLNGTTVGSISTATHTAELEWNGTTWEHATGWKSRGSLDARYQPLLGVNSLTSSRFCGYLSTVGAPTSGTYQFGDRVIDTNKTEWFCITGGTPGTWDPKSFGNEAQVTTEFQGGTYVSNSGSAVSLSTTPTTIPVGSTTNFPSSGTLLIGTGVPQNTVPTRVAVTYTGTTDTSFTGCTVASGTASILDGTYIWNGASGLRAGTMVVANGIITGAGVDGRPHDLVLIAAFDPSSGHTRGDYDIVLTREAGSYGVLQMDLPVHFPRDCIFYDGANNPMLGFASGTSVADNVTATPQTTGTINVYSTLVGSQGTSKGLILRNSGADTTNSKIRLQNSSGTSLLTVGESTVEIPNQTDLRFLGASAGQYAAIQVTSGNTFSIRNVSAAGGRIINSAFTTPLITWDDTGNLTAIGYVKVKAAATTSRPSASTAGAGAHMFDSTLGKPIWSNGTSWVDATGATA